MKNLKRVAIVLPAVVLVLCLVGSFMTRGAMGHLTFAKRQSAGVAGLVDQRAWQTAQALAPLAVSAEEQTFAKEAERLADHSVDQAFALALRQATLQTQSRKLTGEAKELSDKVAELQGLVKEDAARVTALTAAAPKGPDGKPDPNGAGADDLDVAKSQLQLDNDEENDAEEELARASGDKRSLIQQELTAREAAMKKFDEGGSLTGTGQIAVLAAKRYGTLSGRLGAWFDQRSRLGLLAQAKTETDEDVAASTALHAESEVKAGAAEAGAAAGVVDDSGAKGRVARLAQVHALTQIHSIVDDRLQAEKQLSIVYANWGAQVQLQHRIVSHLLLQSLATIAFLILLGVLASAGARALIARASGSEKGMDRRRARTLETIATLGIQLVTLLLVLLVVFGAPNQVPTILGLATAGLTVVFQDFILAFFGWFVLMGRNGIRVGDWVEINGVGGEVVEIGLFRTALLETGNWTDKGHPTGRRVTFINNFAISGQYFNFSTTGQWMWDEIKLNVPAGAETYKTIEAIHTAVLKETEEDAKLAEEEWKRATGKNGLSQFSATPSVDMRPAAAGIDVVVRYVTRAGDRFEMRNKLYQQVIDVLRGAEGEHKGSAPEKG